MKTMRRGTRGRGAGLNNRGFTMLELVSVLAVVGVLAVVATPLMASSFAQTSDRAVAEQLVTILNRGRQLAIARNTDVCVMLGNHSIMYYLGGCNGTVFVGSDTDSNGNIALNEGTSVTGATNVVFTGIGAAKPPGAYVVHNAGGGTGVNVVVPASG